MLCRRVLHPGSHIRCATARVDCDLFSCLRVAGSLVFAETSCTASPYILVFFQVSAQLLVAAGVEVMVGRGPPCSMVNAAASGD